MYHDNWLVRPEQRLSDEELKKQRLENLKRNNAASLPSPNHSGPTMEVAEDSEGELDIKPVEEQPEAQAPISDNPVVAAVQSGNRAASANRAEQRDREMNSDGDIDNPIGQFLEDRAVEVRDWIDDTLQGNQRNKDQIREDRKAARIDGAEKQRELSKEIDEAGGVAGVSREVIRAVAGAGEKQIQGGVGFINLLGDTAKTRLGMVDEDDVYNNVDLPNYIGAQRDLVLAEPTTAVGTMARDMLAFVGMGNKLKMVPGAAGYTQKISQLKGAQRFAASAGMETIIGFMADLIMDPGDGTASDAIVEAFPGVEKYLGMFTTDEESNEWEKRFLNGVEGSVMQYAVDALGLSLRGMKGGARKFVNWLKQNPERKAAEAPAEVVQEAVSEVENIISTGLKENEEYVQGVLDFEASTRQLGLEGLGSDFEQKLPSDTGFNARRPAATEEVLEELDTRGKGEFYHGSSSEIEGLSEGMYESRNVYGQGFYTTEDLTTAYSYTRKGKGNSPTAYKVAEKEPVEFFDLDQPASDEVLRSLDDSMEYAPAVDAAMAQFDDLSKVSTTEIFDEIRAFSKETGTSRDTIQEVFESVQATLRAQGFGGWTHKGGLLTKSGREHQVRIYWDPTNQLDIAKVDGPIPRAKKPVPPKGTRPGKEARIKEDQFNGSRPAQASPYEPYERAGRTAEFPMKEVVKQQDAQRTRVKFEKSGTDPIITDNTSRQLIEATDEEVFAKIDALSRTLGAKQIMKDLDSKNPELKQLTKDMMEKWYRDNAGDAVDMKAFEDNITQLKGDNKRVFIEQITGQRAIKAIIADQAAQASQLSESFLQIKATGKDGIRQAELAIDRLKGLIRIQILDGSRRGKGLAALQGKIRDTIGMDAKERVRKTFEKIDDLKARMLVNDPKAVAEFKTLAEALQLADGDADLTASFTERLFKYGRQNLETTMYNSYLSGLVTQERNILGNMTQIAMRPLELAMGSLGNTADRSSALSMYGAMSQSLREGFQVAKASWADYKPDGIREGVVTDGSMELKLENLRMSAKTPTQNAAAIFATAQYRFMAHPWLQGPMRALNAADRGFRVVSARQQAHFDFMKLSFEDGIKFNPDKFEKYVQTKIKDGDVIDESLLNIAKQDTFQEDLGKLMTPVANAIDAIPVLKFVVPFVRTPTNIIKRSGQYVPLVGRLVYNTPLGDKFFKEYSEVMRGSDETAKAIYRGREGVGIMIGMSFTSLGFMGLSTGSGPSNRGARESWIAAGNQPHSINVGGVWVSNRFLGPIGLLMSAYSDIGMIAQNPAKHREVNGLVAQLMYSTGGALLDQSWTKGLVGVSSTVADILEGKRGLDADGVKDAVASMTRAMIPYQAALRSFNNTLVPGLREYNSEFDKVLAESIPGAKILLGTEKISIFSGEPLVNHGYSALNQAQPFSLREAQQDPVLQKLNDIGFVFSTEFTDKISGVELSAEELHTLNKYWAGTGLRSQLDDLINNDPNFRQSFDRWRNEPKPTPRDKAQWYNMITHVVSTTKEEAKTQFFYDGSPEGTALRLRVERAVQEDAANKAGQYEAAAELRKLANP